MLVKFDLDFSPGWDPRSFRGMTEVRGQRTDLMIISIFLNQLYVSLQLALGDIKGLSV